MKRFLPLGLLLAGCAIAPAAYYDRPSTEECPVYVVQNDGFDDVTIYVDGVRVVWALGLQTTTHATCNVIKLAGVPKIEARTVGGAYRIDVSGPMTIERGSRVFIYVGSLPSYSYARSARK